MQAFTLALNSLKRDWRSGEVGLIAAAVVIAVASLTSVGFFTDRVHKATERQATELLAADLVLDARAPIPHQMRTDARDRGLDTTETLRFRSVVVRDDKLQMAEVKAVEAGYPLRGSLRTASTLFGKESVTDALPQPGQAWADARLLQALDMKVGDRIALGRSTLTISAVLTYEPDRGGDLFNIAPRLLINLADVPATGLILPGSRVRYSLLLSGAADGIAAFRDEIERRGDPELRIEGIRDARPELKRALERSEQFLGLAALVSIALAGLAVAMSAQRYALRHYDHCAIMRCLGAGQGLITRVYLLQLLILALLGSAAGCALGYFAQAALASLAAGMAGEALPSPSTAPLLTGLATGLVTVLGFAMPQLLRLRHVTPLRVLRRDLAPAPLSAAATYGLAVLALALLTPWQSGNLRLTAYVFAGILATLFLLALGARLLIRQLDRLRTRAGAAFRFGLANIARRADLSTAQILGIGLGVMVMLLLTLIRTDLLDTWRNRLPPDAPNYFLINIQPSQAHALRAFLRDRAGVSTELYPMVRGRLTAVNGKPIDPDSYDEPRAQRLAARDFNLSWAGTLPPDNRITAGRWWDGEKPGQTRFSVEEGIAKSLHLKLDDTLTYTVAGQVLSGTITNLRWVDWDSFNVNFFVIANPHSLENFPATYISSFHLGKDKQVLLDLVRQFPSVSVIDVDAILTQVRRIMDQVVRTIEFVFGFTVLAGVIVLLAALQTTHDERSRESALLCALGASRRQILAGLSAEFICLGLLAGVLAAFSATAVEAVLASLIFKMEVVVNPRVWLIAPLVCTLVVTVCGLAGTRRALRTPPVTVLGRA